MPFFPGEAGCGASQRVLSGGDAADSIAYRGGFRKSVGCAKCQGIFETIWHALGKVLRIFELLLAISGHFVKKSGRNLALISSVFGGLVGDFRAGGPERAFFELARVIAGNFFLFARFRRFGGLALLYFSQALTLRGSTEGQKYYEAMFSLFSAGLQLRGIEDDCE